MLSNSEMDLWKDLVKKSNDFEKKIDPLTRKLTGSYYTALDLTYLMMKDLINQLSSIKKKKLHKLSFLEPCVGCGNFVFAYLRVCKEYVKKEDYQSLLNSIYVCDINKDALELYKTSLSEVAKKWFGINLELDYFDKHIGSWLLFNVNEKNIQYRSLSDAFGEQFVNKKFDIVVTNPPYKNLKAEKSHYSNEEQYIADKTRYTSIAKLAKNKFQHSLNGTINLYKLFVEEIIEQYSNKEGLCSLLIPASILSDKTCINIRTHIIENYGIKVIRILPEVSDAVDASQALCAILIDKSSKTDEIFISGKISTLSTQCEKVLSKDVIDKESGDAILILSKQEYLIRKKMKEHPTIKEIPYITNLRGELDLTLNSTNIVKEKTDYKLIRGRNVTYYSLSDIENLDYVNNSFVKKSSKNKYIYKDRLVCQQIANMSKKRRISFSIAPSNYVLANSCNFISVDKNENDVDLFFLLGVLNSSLIDWFFKLTSSNNHVNNYEIDNFPIPVSYKDKRLISQKVKEFIETRNETLLVEIDKLIYEAYGISSIKNDEEKKRSMQKDKSTLSKRLKNDLSYIMPKITLNDCDLILSEKISISDLCIQKNLNCTAFEQKVLLNIEKKYRALKNNLVLNHITFKLSELDLEMISNIPQGGNWQDIPKETVLKSKRLQKITETGGRTTLYGRINYKKPSYTITTFFNRPGNGTYVHPVKQRVLSVREAARFQCFPDDYLFCGNKTDLLKQVGNAVPVFFSYSIGKKIKEKLNCTRSVDLFSGAGGMTLGLKQAGINAVVANDIVESACITLKTNSPEISVICGDITNESIKKQIIKTGLDHEAEIICGGPPCQGFSMAGFRLENDPRNQLFRDFADIVSEVNPKVIVFENVEGIISFNSGKTYKDILELFSELGYFTEGRKLLTNYYGVPQKRKRVILICVRKDLNVLPSELFPDEISVDDSLQVSAFETISDLENVECGEKAKYISSYSSDIIKYLKREITAEDYLNRIRSKTR